MSYAAQRRDIAERLREDARQRAVANGTAREPDRWLAGYAQGAFDAADFIENFQDQDED